MLRAASMSELMVPRVDLQRRGELPWRAEGRDLQDTLAGTGGSLPHRTQVSWVRVGLTGDGNEIIRVNNAAYRVGFASGESNNCLIHSLRQCLGVATQVAAVRQDLFDEYGSCSGEAKVTQTNFLNVNAHWQSVVKSIFRRSEVHQPESEIDIQQFSVLALSRGQGEQQEHGVWLGSPDAPHTLIVMNFGDNHFVPCLPHTEH